MARILAVEDEVLRRDLLKGIVLDFYKDDIVDFAPTYESAVIQVTKTKYDFIFLDHDLGHPLEDDGYKISKMLTNTINKDAKVIVTSMNPVGVLNILSALPNAIRCPIYLVREKWKLIRQ